MKASERKVNTAIVWSVTAIVITGLFGFTAMIFVQSENNLDLSLDVSFQGLKIQTKVGRVEQLPKQTPEITNASLTKELTQSK